MPARAVNLDYQPAADMSRNVVAGHGQTLAQATSVATEFVIRIDRRTADRVSAELPGFIEELRRYPRIAFILRQRMVISTFGGFPPVPKLFKQCHGRVLRQSGSEIAQSSFDTGAQHCRCEKAARWLARLWLPDHLA